MIAHSITICVPYNGCDKNCPYCVARMTGLLEANTTLMLRNLPKVKALADRTQVVTVLMTGKGEPFLNADMLLTLGYEFRHFPLEVQTNGICLNANRELIPMLYFNGFNLIAFSIDKLEQFGEFHDLWFELKKLGFLVRVTLNITNMIPPDTKFTDIAKLCLQRGVDQLTLNNIVIPDNTRTTTEASWITANVKPDQYQFLQLGLLHQVEKSGFKIRELAHGPVVYDYYGLSVTHNDYCVQNSNREDDIRSLIFMEDGHLYTSWNSRASKIF